jgi:hypothetical protein
MARIASHFSVGNRFDRRDVPDAGVVDENIDAPKAIERPSQELCPRPT